jgi:6-hydroxytryprostatin B O-methyltransferase
MILHDWPRTEALLILKNHLNVLKGNPGSRLVIMDTVLPVPGSISSVEEALLRVRDLTMIQSFNSRERELAEFEELFTQTSDEEGRLVLKKVIKPAGSVMSVMEVAYESFKNGWLSNGTSEATTNGTSNGVH